MKGNVGRTTKVLRDSAVLYVNTLGEDEDDESRDYKELHIFLTNLLQDDISCLELVDFLTDAEKMFAEGRVTGAIELLNEAKVRCLESSHKSFDVLESVILREDTGLRTLILQILAVVLSFILIVPPIFIYIRHKRGAKKVDQKEEQIEEWLDEFYK